MLLKLAWRNLWRQKRRTLLTASALALALLLSLLMRSFQEGSYNSNIENVARLSTGLIQLQNPDFKESQSIEDLLPGDNSFIAFCQQHDHITTVLPRIESFTLAAADDKSKGAIVYGIDPVADDIYTHLSSKLTRGDYFNIDHQYEHPPALLGEGLAKKLGLDVGDEIVLYGQGYRGQTAAGIFNVQGLIHFQMSELNNQLLYMELKDAQQFFSTGEMVTSWVLQTDRLDNISKVVKDLRVHYQLEMKKSVTIRDWQDLSPDLAQQIAMDRGSGLIMMYLLYGIVGFGLFATLLMMTLERQREFAVMLATGLLRGELLKLISIESFFIAMLGIGMGLLIATPIIVWFFWNPITFTGDAATMMLEMGYEPILPVLLAPALFYHQVFIVLGLLILCMLYPMWRLYKMDLVSALKGSAYAH